MSGAANNSPVSSIKSWVEKYSLVVLGVIISAGFLAVYHLLGFQPDAGTYIAPGVVALFSLFAQNLINAHRDIRSRLERYSSKLEEMVRERTEDLIKSNEQLQEEISLRRKTEERLRASEARYRTIFENSGAATLISNENGRPLLANTQLLTMTGFSLEELEARDSWTSILENSHQNRVLSWISNNKSSAESPRCFEAVIRCKDGQEKNVFITLASFQESKSVLVSLVDITELKRAEQRLFHQAFHDHLTDLPNRALFMELLNISLRRSRRSRDYLFAVLYMDIDRFKYINDSMGHLFGDRLLVSFAQTIKKCMRDSDTVARMGGDEFAVILDDIQDPSYIFTVMDRINAALKDPLKIEDHTIYVTVSTGIVADCRIYDNPEDIVRDADAAMYGAKDAGRACFKVFESRMHQRFKRTLEMETAMRKALENGEFVLHYQPIISLQGGKVATFEALVRWERPGMGLIHPAEFIPVAEETGLIMPLGRWVLSQACKQMSIWQKTYPELSDCSVSVNLSGRQFNDPELENHIMHVLETSGLSPEYLKLEITENEVMHSPEHAIELLTRIRKAGIKIMIDDFGTGYSSLSYLHRFPIDILKVDRKFVGRLDSINSPSEKKIVENIFSLAHGLNLEVVAEGVESTSQNNFLAGLNCRFVQGFLYYRPMPPEMVQPDFLERISK